jgi:hypothetical protein
MKEENIKKAVRESYAKVASGSSCCSAPVTGSSCCGQVNLAKEIILKQTNNSLHIPSQLL